ncbi:hypothetical protein SDC9_135429 [bioreactor metagenome]|uniref:Uncharacterized protein n=1 Tax=bioreactor metagenome TaxID=1076179 RepID=A0A645DGC9_9ZZZZ
MGELLLFVVAHTEVLLPNAQRNQPAFAEAPPKVEPLQLRTRLAEKFQLHLLKFADAENEVAGGNFVAEALARLSDAERQLAPGCALHVFEVYEHALRRFRTQIQLGAAVLRHALMGFEHHVKLADIRKVAFPAAGAGDLFFADVGHQRLVWQTVGHHVDAIVLVVLLHKVVGPVAHFTGFAVNERVVEVDHMARGNPNLRVHEDSRVNADIVGTVLHKFAPPGALDVVFQLHAQRAVVPGVGQAPVNFAAGVYKAAPLAQGDDFFHGLVLIGKHKLSLRLPPPGGGFIHT